MSATSKRDRPRTGFDNGVITVAPDDAEWLAGMFARAAARLETVRVAIDEGGVKVAVGRGTWTPAIGEQHR